MTDAEKTEILALLKSVNDNADILLAVLEKNSAAIDALAARVELIITWLPKIPNAK